MVIKLLFASARFLFAKQFFWKMKIVLNVDFRMMNYSIVILINNCAITFSIDKSNIEFMK